MKATLWKSVELHPPKTWVMFSNPSFGMQLHQEKRTAETAVRAQEHSRKPGAAQGVLPAKPCIVTASPIKQLHAGTKARGLSSGGNPCHPSAVQHLSRSIPIAHTSQSSWK